MRYVLEARDNNNHSINMISKEEIWNNSKVMQDIKAKAVGDKIRYDKIVALMSGIMDLPEKE